MPIKSKTKPVVIVRCRNAGVHYGTLETRTGTEVELSNARRLWYWDGAASLSELAVYGTKKPGTCKFSVRTPQIEVLDACEIIFVQPDAVKNIEGVPEWRA
jgi:hypothetical protein